MPDARDPADVPAPPSPPSPDAWLRPGWTCATVAPGRSGVLLDAAHYYRALADAIESAERFVLVAGWQLESTVLLRRRPEDEGRPRSLREVLAAACARRPSLRVYVLAWDWSSLYALDREWGTKEKLEEAAPGQIVFHYDATHPQGGSLHDKLAVVDGHTAWVGGIDICEHRWDECAHEGCNPARIDGRGAEYTPYHDVQAVVRGPLALAITAHFVERWERAGNAKPVLEPLPPPKTPLDCAVDLGESLVAFARTRPAMLVPPSEPVREIAALYAEALRSAERLVYLESQYVTSRVVVEALVTRMRDAGRGPLEIVVVMPAELLGTMEKAAIEARQAAALSTLSSVARVEGHAFVALAPVVPRAPDEPQQHTTYVHSKILLVDDRRLTIGSANATNRSMGLDAEVNLAWHAQDPALELAIRAVRIALLADHTRTEARPDHPLGAIEGLVGRLRAIAAQGPSAPLRELTFAPLEARGPLDELLGSLGDPERAALAEGVFEDVGGAPSGLVARLVSALRDAVGVR